MLKIIFILFFNIILFSKEPITPIPLEIEFDKEKANLGKELFFDPILSKDNTISCHSCHILEQGGDDNLQFSFGVDGKVGNMNSPTVFNSTFNFVQFWDGRAKNLQEQAQGPITNEVEMAHTFEEIIKILNNTEYKEKFRKIYKDGVTKNNITDSLAQFQKTLITPNSPFDKYLRGDKNAISKEQKQGYELFKNQGCIACHHGVNVGGNLYAKFGLISELQSDSKGRYEVTKNELDKYYFKVPTLRNIELTAPYLHDGSANDLKSVINIMLKYQIGTIYNEQDIEYLEKFLLTLTGENPKIDKENF